LGAWIKWEYQWTYQAVFSQGEQFWGDYW